MFIRSHSRSICFSAPVHTVWVPVKHLYAYYGVNMAKNAMVYLETGPFNLNLKMSVGDCTSISFVKRFSVSPIMPLIVTAEKLELKTT